MTRLFDEKIEQLEAQLTVARGRFSAVRQYLSNDAILHKLALNRRSLESVLMPYDFARERQLLPDMISITFCHRPLFPGNVVTRWG